MTSESEIPTARLTNDDVWRAVLPRLERLVLSGNFILGAEVDEFERAAAEVFGTSWCVGTSSGTSALTLALRASGLPASARVAIPANTFFSCLEAIVVAGMTPVVVDHDEDYLIDLDQLRSLDVDGVMAVHLYGLPMDMPALMDLADEKGWWVLEDCSQAHGASVGGRSVGSFGHAGAFSAYPTKNLGAWGDAGFITGSDDELEKRLRALRHHGQYVTNEHSAIGGADRLDNLQALVLIEKLKLLKVEVGERRRVASVYRERLEETGLILPNDRGERKHAFHQFVIRVPDRDHVRGLLAQRSVRTGIHYPTPIHQQPAASRLCEVPRRPERAEEWARQIISLPIYPALTGGEIDRIATTLKESLATPPD